jgi:WD40 repeat protein
LAFGLAFSPDGRRLVTAGEGRTLKVWDIDTGKELLVLSGHAASPISVVFSPDGRRILSGSLDRTVKVWDAITGQEVLTLEGHTQGIHSVALSADGLRLASAGDDAMIRIWDATPLTEELLQEREATNVVKFLFGKGRDRLRVLRDIRAYRTMPEAVRQRALLMAERYPQSEEPTIGE